MSNYAPHTYSKSPCPDTSKHLAPQTAQQAWDDYYGDNLPKPAGRRAAR